MKRQQNNDTKTGNRESQGNYRLGTVSNGLMGGGGGLKLVLLVLTAKLLKQGYRYHKLRNAFSKFYRRHYELISKFNVGIKSLLHQGLSEPEFYGDLVYKFKKIRDMTDFSDQFRKNIMRYKRIDYNLNVMRQSACLVINPITVDGYMLHSLIARR